jgi:hypothetical protein
MQIYASDYISARIHTYARLLRGYAHTHMLTNITIIIRIPVILGLANYLRNTIKKDLFS